MFCVKLHFLPHNACVLYSCGYCTDAWWVGAILKSSVFFLLVISLFLALGRKQLFSGARLRKGSGHELADVPPLCSHQLLCRDT